MNSTKLDKISILMARTHPACVGKFSVAVLILMFTKKKSRSQHSILTVLFGRQPIFPTANFFSRGGSDWPYFLMFLGRSQASILSAAKV